MEHLQVVLILHACIHTSVNDKELAEDCTAVVPATRLGSAELLWLHFRPAILEEIIKEYLALHRPVPTMGVPTSVALPTVDAKIVLVR